MGISRELGAVQTFQPASGFLSAIYDGGTGHPIANFTYSFDALGNLKTRTDANAVSGGLTENFCYDSLNRLTNYAIGSTVSLRRGPSCVERGGSEDRFQRLV